MDPQICSPILQQEGPLIGATLRNALQLIEMVRSRDLLDLMTLWDHERIMILLTSAVFGEIKIGHLCNA